MLPLTHVLFYNTIIYTFIRERKEKLMGDYFDFIMKEIYIKYDENLEKEKANIRYKGFLFGRLSIKQTKLNSAPTRITF